MIVDRKLDNCPVYAHRTVRWHVYLAAGELAGPMTLTESERAIRWLIGLMVLRAENRSPLR